MDFGALDAAVAAAFGEPATYTPRGGGAPFPVRGIFDRYQVEVPGPGDSPPASVPFARLTIRAADLPAGVVPRARDGVALRGLTFEVRDPEPDGLGLVVLPLGRA